MRLRKMIERLEEIAGKVGDEQDVAIECINQDVGVLLTTVTHVYWMAMGERGRIFLEGVEAYYE